MWVDVLSSTSIFDFSQRILGKDHKRLLRYVGSGTHFCTCGLKKYSPSVISMTFHRISNGHGYGEMFRV
uniref:Ovule protein n=1 Tax=Loa loa TaxID=7209 RepID=A0A1I7VH48_LOALO